ncbi:uncharacterized protein LOC144101351 [Amblyomma americanum]
MTGFDLDGDEYSVLWYKGLIFNNNCNSMHYYSDQPKERKAPIWVELSTECLEVVEDSLPDPRLLLEEREPFLIEATSAYKRYAMKIRALLKSYRIESKSEALCGALSKLSKYVKGERPFGYGQSAREPGRACGAPNARVFL